LSITAIPDSFEESEPIDRPTKQNFSLLFKENGEPSVWQTALETLDYESDQKWKYVDSDMRQKVFDKNISFRVSSSHLSKLNSYCIANNLSRSEFLREYIDSL